jgi:hypothetical protein
MPLPLFLPCAAGVEPLLEAEVRRLLPGAAVQVRRGGVALPGDPHEVMVLNLESRLAQRVLIEVAEGGYRDEADLYALAQGVDWSDWITPRQTIRVDTTAHRSPPQSLNFAALRIKDGLCDRMRDAHGERPSVDTARPDLPVVLHVDAERAALYVDSSGESLFKRAGVPTPATPRSRRRWPRPCSPPPAGRGGPMPAARCTTRAAARERSPSRRRRSPPGSLPAPCVASPSSACCLSPARSVAPIGKG